ncbi:MAG: CDP-alcohol phosphatidyltransferase family protein [Halobacteria archaeon]|nr:CDP-alcohol phosphatidyltransferase family protein [Halobacteria archaeon]
MLSESGAKVVRMPDDRPEELRGLIRPLVVVAEKTGLTANQVSVFSAVTAFSAGLLASYSTRTGYIAAAFLITVNGVLDLVDGELARSTGNATDRGDALDHTLDRYADTAVTVGFTAGVGEWMLGAFALTGVFLTSYMGTQAEAIGAGRIYRGALARANIIGLGLAGCVLQVTVATVLGHEPLFWVLVAYAVLGHLTAAERFVVAWRRL